MQIIDLTKTIQFNADDPLHMQVEVEHKTHSQALDVVRGFGLSDNLFPKKYKGWADDSIRMGVHSTTHLDAPWHYSPICEGKPAKTIDEIPLEWCFGKGVVINMSHKRDYDPITVNDLVAFLNKENISLSPGMIVLIRTDRDQLMGSQEFFLKGTGMSAAATEWLIDQGIKVMGIDQWGWDLPLPYLIKKAKDTNNPELFWEAHLVGVDREYCHMEQLTNLSALPTTGFKVAAFPLKIKGGSAAPARVVAIIE